MDPPTDEPKPDREPESCEAPTAPISEPCARFEHNPAPGWDRYEIVGFLGEGAMGRVFRAIDLRLQRPVALKFLRSDDPNQVQRFLQEARAQARIEHENVCRVYEVGEVRGMPYIAMQLIDGLPLTECDDRFTVEQKVRIAAQIARALQTAHTLGIIHRDIKPGNIMVEAGDAGLLHPFVMDFGIARAIEAYNQSLRLRNTFSAWSNSGLVWWLKAQHDSRSGRDPGPSLAEAANCYAEAARLNPSHGNVHCNRGLILLDQAEAEAAAGRDPAPAIRQATSALETAVELSPGSAALAEARGDLGRLEARRHW